MRISPLLLLAAATLHARGSGGAASEAKPPAADVPRLIDQLGSRRYAEREQGAQALDALGAPALAELQKAAASPDAEVRRRAAALVLRIERRLETEKILTPRTVRLNFTDRPVLDAVADFGRQTECSVLVEGDRSRLAGRTITLKTGELPFWEAYDRLCREAGLVERTLAQHGLVDPPAAGAKGVRRADPIPLANRRAVYTPGDGRLTLVEGTAP